MKIVIGRVTQTVYAYALLVVVAASLMVCRGAFTEWITLGGSTGETRADAGPALLGGGTDHTA